MQLDPLKVWIEQQELSPCASRSVIKEYWLNSHIGYWVSYEQSLNQFANWRTTVKENPQWNIEIQAVLHFDSCTSLIFSEMVFHGLHFSKGKKKLCTIVECWFLK